MVNSHLRNSPFIGLAVIIAVIKMAITDAKEEADDIERASGNK